MHTPRVLLAAVAALLPLASAPAAASDVAPAPRVAAAPEAVSPQLLVNPGFEAGLNGWTVLRGTPTVSTYGGTDNVATTAPAPPNRGTRYLSGGTAALSIVNQTVDVSGYADDIDLGSAQLELSAYLGGWSDQTDHAVVRAFPATADDRTLPCGCPVLSGGDDNHRAYQTGLLRSVERLPLPVGTRLLHIGVDLTRVSAGVVNDGYADALSVRIVNIDGTSPPPAAPAGSSVELARNGRFDAAAGGTGDVVRAPLWSGGIAVRYDAGGGYPTIADPVPTDHGRNFWAGDPAGFSLAAQPVSVAGWATVLDRGRTIAQLSAYIGGYLTDQDEARVVVHFLDADEDPVSSVVLRAPFRNERFSRTGLWYVGATGLVPAGTRSATLSLQCHRTDGTACDGYVDDVSLRLLNVPPAPVVRLVTPSFIARGTTRTVTISGTGFAAGARVAVSGSGVTVSNVAFVSATELTASLTVTGAAATGKRTVTVTNPSTVKGSCSCLNVS